MPSETPSLLKDPLARAEAALSELERRREQAVAEISSLKARIDAAPTVNTGGGRGSELSPEEKVRLFRSLFRGRDDVFPVRLVSRRKLAFETEGLGVQVVVERIDFDEAEEIGAICCRNRSGKREQVPILDLPLPRWRPRGSEWIEAYRLWARTR